jgi:(R,R)-butanediol dehydrogenase / meso-butanediol dehydrogenase / diacetyl reductase
MQALRTYGGKDLRYEKVMEPHVSPGQIKVRISLAGICGSDLHEYATGPSLISRDNLPLIIGHEFVGEVVELGEGVNGFSIGERVTGEGCWFCGECYYCKKSKYNLCLHHKFTGNNINGCMAGYLVAPYYTFYKVPNSLSDEAGVLIEPLAVALHAVRLGNVSIGSTVGIVGDGTIGFCVLLAAKAAGASRVFIVVKHPGRGGRALAMGATAAIDPKNGDLEQQIKGLTDGLGVDISFDCAGRPDTPQISANLTGRGGTTVIVGAFNQISSFYFERLMCDEKTIVGSPLYINEASMATDLLVDRRIDPLHLTSLVTSKVPLKNAVKMGFEKLMNNKDNEIKVLLQIP